MSKRQKRSIQKKLSFGRKFSTVFFAFLFLYQTEPRLNRAQKYDSIDLSKPLMLCRQDTVSPNTQFASDNADNLYHVTLQGRITSVDVIHNLINWESDLGGSNAANPVVDEQSLFLLNLVKTSSRNPDGSPGIENEKIYIIRSLEKKTGITNWQTKISTADLQGEVYLSLSGNSLFLVSSEGGLMSINKSSGALVQKKKLPVNLTAAPLFTTKNIYLGDFEHNILIVSNVDFRELSRIPTQAAPTSIAVSENLLMWGDERGFVSASVVNSGVKWTTRKGGAILYITGTADGIIAASSDNYVYMISAKNGNPIWKKRFANRAAAAPFVAGGYVIITVVEDSSASITELKTGKTVNKVILPNNVYFTEKPHQKGSLIIFPTSEGFSEYSASKCFEKQ